MGAAVKVPEVEELARVDTRGRSLRVERRQFVGDDGQPRASVALVLYRLLRGDQWHREKSVSVRKNEIHAVIEGLSRAVGK